MRRWGIRTRDVLAITLLTLTVVGTTTAVHVARLSELGVEQAQERAESRMREISALAAAVLARAPARPPDDALAEEPAVPALLDAMLAHAPDLMYARIESRGGETLVGAAPTEDATPPEALALEELANAGFARRLWLLFRDGQLVETRLPLQLEGRAFGRVRLGIDTSLLRAQLVEALRGSAGVAAVALVLSWLVALAVAHLTRRPIRRLSRQIERLRAGDYELEEESWDLDFAGLASQLGLLGKEMHSERLRLLAERQSLQEILDHLADGILLTDEDDAIVFYNRALAALVGRALEEVVGLPLDEVVPSSHPISRAVRRSHVEEEDLEHLQVALPSEGRFREALLSAFRIVRGRSPGVLVVLEDLAGLRMLQDLVRYSVRATEMGRMTAGVAHEVRNPLNAMHLHLALLREDARDDPELSRRLDLLDDAVRSLNRIVEGLLDTLRPAPLQCSELDLHGLLRGLVTFFEEEARARGVRIELPLEPTKMQIRADAERLRQVFVNLIQNAFDAMPDGGTLTLRSVRDGSWVRVEVEDTGKGIAPEDRERIFQLYYTTRPDGFGIGLSTVKRIVLDHGGSVTVASEPGAGARFGVVLPVGGPGAAFDADAADAA